MAALAAWVRRKLARRVPSRSAEASTARTNPSGPTRWESSPVLLPGLAHMSSTVAPGGGSSRSGGSMEERSWM